MAERKHQIQVGILFLLSVVILVWGIMWFKEIRIGERSYDLIGVFRTSSGLLKGDPVEVLGVPSGEVAEINYKGGHALVRIRIHRDIQLHPGTRIAIENVGIMGQKLVAIYPGPEEGPVLPPGSRIQGFYNPGIPELMLDMGEALNSFEALTARIDTLLVTFQGGKPGQMKRTFDNLEQVTGDLAGLVSENRESLASSLQNLDLVLADLHDALGGRGKELGQTIDHAGTAMSRLDTTMVQLSAVTTRLDSLLARLESGEGTAGKLLQDDQIYDQLQMTLEETRLLLEDVRVNPGRYFKFSIF